MSDGSKIEWTDATWNPITGCSVVSPGCTNCYAMGLAGTRLRHHPSRAGLTRASKAGPVWTGEVRLNEQWLDQPVAWKRPRRVFVCAHGDLFHEAVPDAWIDRVFVVIGDTPQHTYQILTKRSARMRAYLERLPGRIREWECHSGLDWLDFPLPNVWLGVSAERQEEADARVPDLLATPAAVRFVSAEPLLGPVDLTKIASNGDSVHPTGVNSLRGTTIANVIDSSGQPDGIYEMPIGRRLDWVIVGGESGPAARPMHPAWARDLRDQCTDAGVPFFFKQWGAWAPILDRDKDDPDWRREYSNALAEGPDRRWLNLDGGRGFHGERFHVMARVGKKAAGRLLDGREWSEMPAAPAAQRQPAETTA